MAVIRSDDGQVVFDPAVRLEAQATGPSGKKNDAGDQPHTHSGGENAGDTPVPRELLKRLPVEEARELETEQRFGYVGGGRYDSTLKAFQKRLADQGWKFRYNYGENSWEAYKTVEKDGYRVEVRGELVSVFKKCRRPDGTSGETMTWKLQPTGYRLVRAPEPQGAVADMLKNMRVGIRAGHSADAAAWDAALKWYEAHYGPVRSRSQLIQVENLKDALLAVWHEQEGDIEYAGSTSWLNNIINNSGAAPQDTAETYSVENSYLHAVAAKFRKPKSPFAVDIPKPPDPGQEFASMFKASMGPIGQFLAGAAGWHEAPAPTHTPLTPPPYATQEEYERWREYTVDYGPWGNLEVEAAHTAGLFLGGLEASAEGEAILRALGYAARPFAEFVGERLAGLGGELRGLLADLKKGLRLEGGGEPPVEFPGGEEPPIKLTPEELERFNMWHGYKTETWRYLRAGREEGEISVAEVFRKHGFYKYAEFLEGLERNPPERGSDEWILLDALKAKVAAGAGKNELLYEEVKGKPVKIWLDNFTGGLETFEGGGEPEAPAGAPSVEAGGGEPEPPGGGRVVTASDLFRGAGEAGGGAGGEVSSGGLKLLLKGGEEGVEAGELVKGVSAGLDLHIPIWAPSPLATGGGSGALDLTVTTASARQGGGVGSFPAYWERPRLDLRLDLSLGQGQAQGRGQGQDLTLGGHTFPGLGDLQLPGKIGGGKPKTPGPPPLMPPPPPAWGGGGADTPYVPRRRRYRRLWMEEWFAGGQALDKIVIVPVPVGRGSNWKKTSHKGKHKKRKR